MGRDGAVLALGGVGGYGRIQHGAELDLTKTPNTVTSYQSLKSNLRCLLL